MIRMAFAVALALAAYAQASTEGGGGDGDAMKKGTPDCGGQAGVCWTQYPNDLRYKYPSDKKQSDSWGVTELVFKQPTVADALGMCKEFSSEMNKPLCAVRLQGSEYFKCVESSGMVLKNGDNWDNTETYGCQPAQEVVVPGSPGSLFWSQNIMEDTSSINQVMPGDIHNGVLFAVQAYGNKLDSHKNLFALKLDTQETIWSVKTAGIYDSIYHGPIYDDGHVYVASSKGRLYAFDSSNGSKLWDVQASQEEVQFWLVMPLIVGDAIIAPNGDGKAYARNKTTGDELWTFQFGIAHQTGGHSGPTYGEGNVYFGSDDKHLYAVNLETGVQVWRYTNSRVGNIRSKPAYHDGVVYFSHYGGYVVAVNAATGKLIWEQEITDNPYMCGVVYANGMVYMGTYNGKTMHALDASTGAERWRYSVGGTISITPTVADGILYLASKDAHVYALNSSDGNYLWDYETKTDITGLVGTFPVSNGVIYIGDSSANIYAVNVPASATGNPTPGPIETSGPSTSPSATPSLSPSTSPTPGPTSNPTPGPTGNPTPGPTTNPTPGPTSNPTPGPTGNPTPGPTSNPTPGPTSQVDGLVDAISKLSAMVKENSDVISEIKGLLNQHGQASSCFNRRAQL